MHINAGYVFKVMNDLLVQNVWSLSQVGNEVLRFYSLGVPSHASALKPFVEFRVIREKQAITK